MSITSSESSMSLMSILGFYPGGGLMTSGIFSMPSKS